MGKSPQAFDSATTLRLYGNLIVALLPVAVAASLSGGWLVAFTIVSTMFVGWAADALMRLAGGGHEKEDASAVLWGLLLALLMPPTVPFWVPWTGILFSVIVIKGLMGGSGSPWLNPVLAGWAFVQAAWPTLVQPNVSLSGAGKTQVLELLSESRSGFDQTTTDWLNGNLLSWLNIQLPGGYLDLMTGMGPNGHSWNAEAGVILLLIATVFLLVRRSLPWQVPALFFVGFAVPMALAGGDVLFQMFSGYFLLGIFFLATENSSRPVTKLGMVVYAVGAGVLAFLLRTWGDRAEGLGYAILLMNFTVPWLDSVLRKKVLNDLR